MDTRKQLCPLGLKAKQRLLELNKTQNWLIKQVCKDTGKYVDPGYLAKIWTGQRQPPKIITSICKILDITNQK